MVGANPTEATLESIVNGVDAIKNQIHHCDYKQLLAQIPDASVDLIVTDPPYGINYQNHHTKNKHEVLESDKEPFSYYDLARECYRVMKPDTAAFFFTGWSVYPQHFIDVERAGFEMKPTGVMQKTHSVGDLDGAFASNSEWCIHAVKGRFKFRKTNLLRYKWAEKRSAELNGEKIEGEFKTRFPACWFGDEFPMAAEPAAFQKKYRHPTPKGQTMIMWLIQLASDKGGLVVDPFSGSGTTAAACILTDRDFITCEINEEFVATGRRRISRSHIGGFM